MGNSLCCGSNPLSETPDLQLVPATPTVTAEWLTAALRRSGRLTATQRVLSLTVGQVTAEMSDGTAAENGGGLAGGAVVRITDIVYGGLVDGSSGGGAALPRVLIHKWCSASEILQAKTFQERLLMGVLFRLENYYGVRQEITVYKDLAKELNAAGVATPTVFYCALDDGGKASDTPLCCAICCPRRTYLRSTVLCEDMGARGFTAGLVTSGPRLSQQSALAAITALARLHAWGWGGRERGERESKWTALIAGHLKLSHALLKHFHTDTTLQTFLDVWSPREHASDLREPGLRSMLWDLRANFSSWFERGCNMPRDQTLLHGDFHLGNIFVKEDDEVMTQPDDVTVIDWAYMGAGHSSWELNYFLSLSCDGSHEDDMALLAAYHDGCGGCARDQQHHGGALYNYV